MNTDDSNITPENEEFLMNVSKQNLKKYKEREFIKNFLQKRIKEKSFEELQKEYLRRRRNKILVYIYIVLIAIFGAFLSINQCSSPSGHQKNKTASTVIKKEKETFVDIVFLRKADYFEIKEIIKKISEGTTDDISLRIIYPFGLDVETKVINLDDDHLIDTIFYIIKNIDTCQWRAFEEIYKTVFNHLFRINNKNEINIILVGNIPLYPHDFEDKDKVHYMPKLIKGFSNNPEKFYRKLKDYYKLTVVFSLKDNEQHNKATTTFKNSLDNNGIHCEGFDSWKE